jgi:hypothetical protein
MPILFAKLFLLIVNLVRILSAQVVLKFMLGSCVSWKPLGLSWLDDFLDLMLPDLALSPAPGRPLCGAKV